MMNINVIYIFFLVLFSGILIGDHVGLPSGYRWFTYLYASIILFICFVICLIGATMFARTSIFILCVCIEEQQLWEMMRWRWLCLYNLINNVFYDI